MRDIRYRLAWWLRRMANKVCIDRDLEFCMNHKVKKVEIRRCIDLREIANTIPIFPVKDVYQMDVEKEILMQTELTKEEIAYQISSDLHEQGIIEFDVHDRDGSLRFVRGILFVCMKRCNYGKARDWHRFRLHAEKQIENT